MLQSHENWKIEHSQITRNLLSSLVGLTWLSRSQVTKGTGSVVLVTRHSSFTCTIRCTVQCVLYSTGLHLYNMVYSTVQYGTVQNKASPRCPPWRGCLGRRGWRPRVWPPPAAPVCRGPSHTGLGPRIYANQPAPSPMIFASASQSTDSGLTPIQHGVLIVS